MHGVRARTPVYFQSLKESLASICYILDRTSPLWTFRGVYNDRKVVFDNNEKHEEKNDIRDVGSTADLALVFLVNLVHWYPLVPTGTWLYLIVPDCTWLYLIVPDCT